MKTVDLVINDKNLTTKASRTYAINMTRINRLPEGMWRKLLKRQRLNTDIATYQPAKQIEGIRHDI